MTDFGIKDGNIGVMKGVIAGISPGVPIIDLSHLIGPQNILEASLILARSAPYFPAGSIHVVVVDPGVGTARRPMLAQLGGQFYVGPDNGAITRWLEGHEAEGGSTAFYELNQSRYWLPKVSHVFHGRDIFAPVAAHLASGVPAPELGSLFERPVRLELSRPRRIQAGWSGEIIHIDHFGNIAANIYREHLAGASGVTVKLCGVNIHGMSLTFGERPPGELIALFGSTGNLVIATVNGNAALALSAKVGDGVEVTIVE